MSSPEISPLVSASGVSISFSSRRGEVIALDGVDLLIWPGEHTAVCGHSGSGKSTLLAVIAGLCRPGAGTVQVQGTEPLALSRQAAADFRARHLGLLFQSPGLLPNLRLIDNTALPMVLAGNPTGIAYLRASEMLRLTGLGDRLDAFPGELSGGQQRRAALARALVNKPALLLADEPTNDLDGPAAAAVLDLMLQLAQEAGTTLLLVTHDLAVANRMRRVVTLSAGKITADKRTADLDLAGSESAGSPSQPRVGPVGAFGYSPSSLSGPVEMAPAASWMSWLGMMVGWLCLGAGGLFALDQVVALWQGRMLVEETAKRRLSETLAMESLRADILEVISLGEGKHRVTLFLENYGQGKMFVLGPALGLHYQVGRKWEPVPILPVGEFATELHAINKEKSRFSFEFTLPGGSYDELMAGYLHMRITGAMVVGASPDPSSDLFERTDDYYFYLKDPKNSDMRIRELNRWGPASVIPPWIAMPSH